MLLKLPFTTIGSGPIDRVDLFGSRIAAVEEIIWKAREEARGTVECAGKIMGVSITEEGGLKIGCKSKPLISGLVFEEIGA